MHFRDIICPVRFRPILRQYGRHRQLTILDIGCGNYSPSLTKHWFSECAYHGADIQEYNLADADQAAMDRFFLLDTDGGGYEQIPDNAYDFIIMNHVLEHMDQPEEVLPQVCRKLKPGGVIWLAFPSPRALNLPSADVGCLNFCDDETHRRVVAVNDLANILLDHDIKVLRGGRSHDLMRTLVGCAMLPIALLRKGLTGRMHARGLWYIFGFEDRIIGQRRSASS
jgi:2-polyprenyl-3-methyl-5-hydroxy-6-metoxy-1,4-benzoquinol methylase